MEYSGVLFCSSGFLFFFFYSGLEIFQDEARIQVAQTFLSSSTEAKTNNKGALYDTGKFFNPAFYSWPNCRPK